MFGDILCFHHKKIKSCQLAAIFYHIEYLGKFQDYHEKNIGKMIIMKFRSYDAVWETMHMEQHLLYHSTAY